jgi:hypothetical protein
MTSSLIKYLIAVVIVFMFFNVAFETFQNNSQNAVTFDAYCPNCVIHNHVDARAKCESACKANDPAKDIIFTGKRTVKDNKTLCECTYKGTPKKDYVGCPTPSSLGGNDCFIFTNDDAKKTCPILCNKYLVGKNSRWTGEYKTTSTHTSACECEYID